MKITVWDRGTGSDDGSEFMFLMCSEPLLLYHWFGLPRILILGAKEVCWTEVSVVLSGSGDDGRYRTR